MHIIPTRQKIRRTEENYCTEKLSRLYFTEIDNTAKPEKKSNAFSKLLMNKSFFCVLTYFCAILFLLNKIYYLI